MNIVDPFRQPYSAFALTLLRHGVEGICVRGKWSYVYDGEPCTNLVNTLVKRGLAEVMYFTGGKSAMYRTEQGQKLLDEYSDAINKVDHVRRELAKALRATLDCPGVDTTCQVTGETFRTMITATLAKV